MASRQGGSQNLRTLCAWCRRTPVAGAWVALDSLSSEAQSTDLYSHGICPDCISEQERLRRAALAERNRAASLVRCVACGRRSEAAAKGWRAYPGERGIGMYCPGCAGGELG
jgi:hypothetical protein